MSRPESVGGAVCERLGRLALLWFDDILLVFRANLIVFAFSQRRVDQDGASPRPTALPVLLSVPKSNLEGESRLIVFAERMYNKTHIDLICAFVRSTILSVLLSSSLRYVQVRATRRLWTMRTTYKTPDTRRASTDTPARTTIGVRAPDWTRYSETPPLRPHTWARIGTRICYGEYMPTPQRIRWLVLHYTIETVSSRNG